MSKCKFVGNPLKNECILKALLAAHNRIEVTCVYAVVFLLHRDGIGDRKGSNILWYLDRMDKVTYRDKAVVLT